MTKAKRQPDDVLAEIVEVRKQLATLSTLHARQHDLYVEGHKLGLSLRRMAAAGGEPLAVTDQTVGHVVTKWKREHPKEEAELQKARRKA